MFSQAFPTGDDGDDEASHRKEEQPEDDNDNSHLHNVAAGIFGGNMRSRSFNKEGSSATNFASPTFQSIVGGAAESPSSRSAHHPLTPIPLEIVSHDNITVFEDLVGRVESFLLDAFQTHSTLSALISPAPFNHPNSTTQKQYNNVSRPADFSSTVRRMKCAASEQLLTPVKGLHGPISSASPLSAAEFPLAASSVCEFSPAEALASGGTQGTFIMPVSPNTNVPASFNPTSNILNPVVMVKDFPVLFPSVQQQSGRHFGPPSGEIGGNYRAQYPSFSFPSSYVMRVEIHYRDDQHELTKSHGVPLFLLVRQKPAGRAAADGRRGVEHSPSGASYAQSSGVHPPISPSDPQNPLFPHFRERSAEGVDVDGEEVELWTSAAHSHQSQSSFHLSVLWTAVNNVFGDEGPLQLDLQHVFHRHQAGIGPASAVHPPLYLRCGASLRLPSIFTLPTTAIPCFVTNTCVHHSGSTISASPSGVNANALDGFSRYDAYWGVSSIYSPLSEYHKNLLAAVSQGTLSVSDISIPTSLSFSVGQSGKVTATGAGSLPLVPPQPKLMTEFWDLPILSTAALPSISMCQQSSTSSNNSSGSSTVSQAVFSLGGSEMIRYLVECFRLQIGPRALLHVWRQGCGNTSSTSSAKVNVRPSSTRRGMTSSNSKEEPFCCISVRKNYRLQLRRQLSGAAAALPFGWTTNSDTTWEDRLATFNTVLRRRCGGTTYPIGVLPRPVDYISFNFQWNQIGEEDAAHPDTLDPFHFLASQRSHSSGHGEDGAVRHAHPTAPLLPTVVEACSIKARAILRKREECQNKAARNIQAILRRYLQVLRRSTEVPYTKKTSLWDASVGRSLAQHVEAAGESRAHSTTRETVNSEGYNIHYYEIKETVKKLMRHPDVEPDVQAAMVLALVDSNNASNKIGVSKGPDAGKSISMLMDEEPGKNSKKGQVPRSAKVPSSTADEAEEKIIAATEASELAALMEEIGPTISPSSACILRSPLRNLVSSPSMATSTAHLPHRESSISRSIARGDDQTGMGVSSGAPNNPTSSGQLHNINDIRLGYIPGSFLCRLAFYAGELLATCESDEVADEGLSALMDTWNACLDEFETLLLSSRTDLEHARKKLETLLLLLGLPNRRGVKQASAVDLTQSLLVQKLQFLFYCIRHLHSQAASSSARSTTVDPRRGVDGNVSMVGQLEGSRLLEEENPLEEWYPELLQMKEAQLTSDEDEEEEEEPNETGDNRSGAARVHRGGSALTLITNGERLIAPPPLPHPPSTSDVLFQQSTLPLSAAEVGVVPFAKLCTFSVYNDMCLFLYVNQGRVVRFPDFVQWVSPRDFQRPHEASRDDNAYLSDRMKVPAEEAIWHGDEKSSPSHKDEEDVLTLPAFSSPGEEGLEEPVEPPSGLSHEATASYGHNNVWWALWCRATPRPPAQILSDSLHHYDQALELLHWLRGVSPATLCLELTQATVANAIHRLLVGPNVVDPSSTPFNNPVTGPSLKSFLQKKTQSIFNHLAPITGLLTMSSVTPAALKGRAMSSAMGVDDGEIAKVALEEAVWEVYDMEIAVCAAMELEDSINREYHIHHPHNSASSPAGNGGVFSECMETARILGSPSVYQPNGGGDRLHLSMATVSIDAWKQGFATLFEKGKERVPLEATVRLTSLAERPAGTSPCFQQLIAQSRNSTGTLHLSVSLSKEII